jgi:hypothetical protein
MYAGAAAVPLIISGAQDPTPEFRALPINSDLLAYTPYEGVEVTGWPVMTILRGNIIIENGKLIAEKGAGEFLPRPPISPQLSE